MENRAFETALALWEKKPEPVLDTDQIKAIDEIMARARKEFLD